MSASILQKWNLILAQCSCALIFLLLLSFQGFISSLVDKCCMHRVFGLPVLHGRVKYYTLFELDPNETHILNVSLPEFHSRIQSFSVLELATFVRDSKFFKIYLLYSTPYGSLAISMLLTYWYYVLLALYFLI